MKVGTKSLLFGVHQFALHPIFVALAWWKLYGFPRDPRLWVAFVVHDWGYWGKKDIDGNKGKGHPMLGGRIMARLFDRRMFDPMPVNQYWDKDHVQPRMAMYGDQSFPVGKWGQFTLYHSRHFAKRVNMPVSRLCVADKLACAITPAWLYVPCAMASGEMDEYLANSRKIVVDHAKQQAAAAAMEASGSPASIEAREYTRIYGRNSALIQMRQAAQCGDAWKWKHAISQYMREEVAVLIEEAGVSA
jgi:hypothetical protein